MNRRQFITLLYLVGLIYLVDYQVVNALPNAIRAAVSAGSPPTTPLAFDNSAVGNGTNGDSTTQTVSLTVAGSNTHVTACVAFYDGGGATISGTPTFAGSNMNLVNSGSQSSVTLAVYELKNVPTGANNFSVTFSDVTWRSVGVVSFNGANQTTPVGTSAQDNCGGCMEWGLDHSITVTVGTNGQSIDCQMWVDNPGTVSSYTAVNNTHDAADVTWLDIRRQTATGSVTYSETWVNAVSGRHLALPINSN